MDGYTDLRIPRLAYLRTAILPAVRNLSLRTLLNWLRTLLGNQSLPKTPRNRHRLSLPRNSTSLRNFQLPFSFSLTQPQLASDDTLHIVAPAQETDFYVATCSQAHFFTQTSAVKLVARIAPIMKDARNAYSGYFYPKGDN